MRGGPINRASALLLLLLAGLSLVPASAQPRRATPYWASIDSGRAMMRVGPGRNYQASWVYVRPDLPIRVLDIYQSWRKIQDPDGTVGWMLVSLLSDTRTAIVRGDGLASLHERPDEAAPVRFRAEPGVVGRVSRCNSGWCHFDVGGRSGYVRTTRIWGVGENETIG